MATSPIYLTEADVGRLVTVKDAIATLEALFATWGQPSTSNLPRQRARLAGCALAPWTSPPAVRRAPALPAMAPVPSIANPPTPSPSFSITPQTATGPRHPRPIP